MSRKVLLTTTDSDQALGTVELPSVYPGDPSILIISDGPAAGVYQAQPGYGPEQYVQTDSLTLPGSAVQAS